MPRAGYTFWGLKRNAHRSTAQAVSFLPLSLNPKKRVFRDFPAALAFRSSAAGSLDLITPALVRFEHSAQSLLRCSRPYPSLAPTIPFPRPLVSPPATNSLPGEMFSPRRGTAPPGMFLDQQVQMGQLNPASDANFDEEPEENESEAPEGGREGGDGGGGGTEGLDKNQDGLEGGGGDGVDEGDKPEEDEEPPFDKGSFFFKVDDKDKGHYKVRDVSRFLLTSMYKRKDRVTRTAGVSLLVGKLENPPHEEKVISALFDTDRFTERAAAQWWEDNGHRFEDARSLAEKKVRNECQPGIVTYISSLPLPENKVREECQARRMT